MNEQQISFALKTLRRIADALEVIALASAPKAPNFVRTIAEYPDFDWAGIGAEVAASDGFGAAQVRWGGYLWTRRAPDNKYAEAVWFSRPDGKDADGNNRYVRLITFKQPAEAEPMGRKVEKVISETARAIEAPPSAGNAPRYDPLKDPRLSALVRPGAALDLDGIQPSVTLFWRLVHVFRVDKSVAADVLREAGGDLAQGIRNLDRIAAEF